MPVTSHPRPTRLDFTVVREHHLTLHLSVEGFVSCLKAGREDGNITVEITGRKPHQGQASKVLLTLPIEEAVTLQRQLGRRLRGLGRSTGPRGRPRTEPDVEPLSGRSA